MRYGGGPTLAQKVISSGLSETELSVEVYPLRLHLYLKPKGDRSTIRISKKETVGELHRKACEIFSLESEQACIWEYFGQRKHVLINDMDKSLEDVNIQTDQDAASREVEKIHGMPGVSTRGSSGGLTGLWNLGNTCYMNSAIQCLVHTPEFALYFLDVYHQELLFVLISIALFDVWTGETRFEDRELIKFSRDQLLQLREVVKINDDILRVK